MKPTDAASAQAIDSAVSILGEHNRSLFEAIYGCGYCDGRISLLDKKLLAEVDELLTPKPEVPNVLP